MYSGFWLPVTKHSHYMLRYILGDIFGIVRNNTKLHLPYIINIRDLLDQFHST